MAEIKEKQDIVTEDVIEDVPESLWRKSRKEKRLVLKQDLTILPLLALGYFFGYWDRGQIGNARLMGLQASLRLDNQQYFDALMIFYVGFLLIELPAALLMRVIPAQFVFGGAVLVFGLCATLISTAKGSAALMILRLFLGFGEAVMTLGFLYCSLWYKPEELALRSGLIYWSTTMAGFTGGLIAYAVAKHPPGHGLRSWQWLFIIEGIPTLVLGVTILLVLPSLPDQVARRGHWLFRNPEQHELILERSRASRNVIGARVVPRQILIALKDPKTWLGSLVVAAPALGITAFNVFLPTFLKEFGFDVLTAQLYTIIPYSFAIISTPLASWLSDRYRCRAIPLAICLSTSILGFIFLLSTTNKVALMAGCCFVAAGAYPCITIGASWISYMHGGYTKRSMAFAVSQMFVQGYSIIGTQIYKKPPRFFLGHGVILGFYLLALVSDLILYIWLGRVNRKRDAEAVARTERGVTDIQLGDYEELCDYHPDWRYMV